MAWNVAGAIPLMTSRHPGPIAWIVGTLGVCAPALLAASHAAPAPTFSKEVAPILFKHCAICHRPGEIASGLSLLSYDTAQPRAAAIKAKVLKRAMPPWPADPSGSVKFRNDARLSRQEIDTLVAWADAGAPRGNDADLPPLPTTAQRWLHPQGRAPDAVVSLPEFAMPASGEIPYIQQLIKVPFSEDKWVVAIQVLPWQSLPAASHGDHRGRIARRGETRGSECIRNARPAAWGTERCTRDLSTCSYRSRQFGSLRYARSLHAGHDFRDVSGRQRQGC